jgi:hypothetical protein
MDGTGDHQIEQDKPSSKKPKYCASSADVDLKQ